jgi:hypothetical protein
MRWNFERVELMRNDSMGVLIIKQLTIEWGKMRCEWTFAGLNGLVRTA